MKREEFRTHFINTPTFHLNDVRSIEPDFLTTNINRRRKQWYIQTISRGRYRIIATLDEQQLFDIANTIYQPSYISMESALRYYDLIPEWVFTTTSCTTRKTQKLSGDCGTFRYYHLKPDRFRWYDLHHTPRGKYLIASPSKTICDMFILKSRETMKYFDDLRRDRDVLNDLCTPAQLDKTAQKFWSPSLTKRINDFISYRQSSCSH